ncbi:predicted metal-dependent membrane protease [Clostridium sp. SY8519]|uniref:CPBP family intramembrane glutamic endopeptidase n=1 Tax=Clostridium sp. (strain SY8519) TaxID=1042156 RepID=UPI0002171C38|nr:CPBP family intramembrane glutamic endopeptidase [Clostridium sp. SY8519]BAK46497.1 predicted metal-dependent membrane protease [Clostridium sp. SY8519]
MNRPGNIAKSILAAVVAILLLLAAQIIVLTVTGIQSGDGVIRTLTKMAQSSAGIDKTVLVRCYILFTVLVFVLFGIWYQARFVRPYAAPRRKTSGRFTLLTILTLILLGVGTQFIAQLIMNAEEKLMPALYQASGNAVSNLAENGSFSLWAALYIIILAPIAEELIFRGVVYRYARLNMSFLGADILQAVLFGIYHMNLIQGIYAFVIGLFLGFVASRGRGIRYSILLHILFNAFGFFFSSFFEGLPALLPVPSYAFGIGVTIFTMYVYAFEFKPSRRKAPQDTRGQLNDLDGLTGGREAGADGSEYRSRDTDNDR